MKSSMQESNTPSLRFGHVTDYDPSRHMARVHFPDLALTSYWLPVLTHNTFRNHDETHVDIGEHVACMLSGDGAEMGVVLGAFYDDKNTPPVANADIRSVTFSDGVRVLYDRQNHSLVIDAPEHINVEAGRIIHAADSITHSAETITRSADRITDSAQVITHSAETLAINAQSFSVSGGDTGVAGISGRVVRITGENIPVTSKTITIKADSIILDGEVTCPGYCHCDGH